MTDEESSGVSGEAPPKSIPPAPRSRLATRLRNYFLTGIVVTAPISLTAYLTWEFIAWVDNKVTPLVPVKYNPETYLPFSIPGLGLVIMVVFLTFVGFVTASFFGRALIRIGENLVNRVPVVRTVYNALRQVLETVFTQSSNSFRQVVLVEYPRRGIWTTAFVTSDTNGEIARLLDDDLLNIYVPTTPNPTSGFLLVVPRRDLIFLDTSVEEATKFIISLGIISSQEPDALTASLKAGAVAPSSIK